ncbi:peptidoglycan-binding domain-containing protein [Actinocatenispora rupis]|uniref:Peptidoglycan binding-like domain-containing protein n=1 Tax=Actinocatenispora rupis TaxID=519421 RepID=A0A8J3JHT4_9ACTN|nr:peptidoglycan-binding domain-containing protein [Actinocatenispora rupis]GID15213.1 hypothetical protein Aru02nite_61020 [Actinocatenispora rupis]
MSAMGNVRRLVVAVAGAMVDGAAAEVPPVEPGLAQELLVDAGLLRPGQVTGRFDLVTATAVRRFQAGAGLVSDGVVGPRTAQALSRAAADRRQLRALGLAA